VAVAARRKFSIAYAKANPAKLNMGRRVARLADLGSATFPTSPRELGKFIADESNRTIGATLRAQG
jgi:hypothetical protein